MTLALQPLRFVYFEGLRLLRFVKKRGYGLLRFVKMGGHYLTTEKSHEATRRSCMGARDAHEKTKAVAENRGGLGETNNLRTKPFYLKRT